MTPYIYTGLSTEGKWNFTYKVKESEPQNIINAVCSVLNIKPDVLIGTSRVEEIVDARCIAIALIKKSDPNITLKFVGSIFNRHHSTVLHNIDKFNDLNRFDKSFSEKVKQVKELV